MTDLSESGQAGVLSDDEIEITPEMVEAGQQAWADLGLSDRFWYDPSPEVLAALFKALLRASGRS